MITMIVIFMETNSNGTVSVKDISNSKINFSTCLLHKTSKCETQNWNQKSIYNRYKITSSAWNTPKIKNEIESNINIDLDDMDDIDNEIGSSKFLALTKFTLLRLLRLSEINLYL